MSDEAVFRSADMSLVQLYIPYEVARDVAYALGELGSVQLLDLNKKVSTFQRSFVKESGALDNALRQLRYISSEIRARKLREVPVTSYLRPQAAVVTEIMSKLDELEHRIAEMKESEDKFKMKQTQLIEEGHFLRALNKFFGGSSGPATRGITLGAGIDVVAGIIPRANINAFERVLWRSLRGNLIMSFYDIEEQLWDDKQKEAISKSVFVVVTHGQELANKAVKAAEVLGAQTYEVQPSEEGRIAEGQRVSAHLAEIDVVIKSTAYTLVAELESVLNSIALWALLLKREKQVYAALNLFSYDVNRKLLIAEGWIPTAALNSLQQMLRQTSERASIETPVVINLISTNRTPPTYHQTNKVTESFQAMIDVYAVASYQEVNPALPTIVTFPFIFAVMFGDLGHGMLLAMAALVLVINEKTLAKVNQGDIFEMAYSGRYMLLMMGCFAMFTGLVYNDIFSKSMTLFCSGWEWPDHKMGEVVTAVQRGIYFFGLDPAWHGTDNNLLFTNSYKMKLSVLLGYLHMSYSYMFSLVNAFHFKSRIDMIGNFIPGLLFFQSIFGYLTFTILYKWSVDWISLGRAAPSLLNMLINMFLAPGQIDEQLYPGQKQVQVFLVIVALISVPCLLLIKPLYFWHKLKSQYEPLGQLERDIGDSVDGDIQIVDCEDGTEQEHQSFSDILIHQIIHTIEFCLNSVSHTASYLRLWALSLAHAQLSQVLWSMTIQSAFNMRGSLGVIMTTVLFAMWFVLTVSVLVVMEGTSAMLHALRLHWVESMSKYYIGEGRAFKAFSFKNIDTH